MRLTERDKRILEAIHAYDGMLAAPQIQRLFFTGKTQMETRARLLFQHGFLNRPDRRRRGTLPAMIYWLGERGAAWIAGLDGQTLKEFVWRQEPLWSQVEHTVAVNDFRITLGQACRHSAAFTLQEWIPQSEFWAKPDRIEYTPPDGKKRKRSIRPDGYGVVVLAGKRFRLLLELDRATEDNPRFTREKVYPGLAYLRSNAYERRFGYRAGRWLIVTTGERHLRNLKGHTERAAGKDARVFYFTTIARVRLETVLTAPIWWRGSEESPRPLFMP
jgi:hypothetical protein